MIHHPRLLPLTITAMVGLLGVKSVLLVQQAIPGAPQVRLVASAAAATPDPPAATTHPTSPALPSGAPPVTDSERAVLQELRQRRAELEAREARAAAREQLMAAAEHRLATRLDELTALQAKLEALDQARRQRDDSNWQGLVRLYESMKPRDAATIFNELDMAVLLPVVDRMKEAKAAAIMAAMDPAKARTVTTSLAALRLKSNSVAGG